MVWITTNRVRGQRDLWGEASVDHFGCWQYIAPLFGILKSKWNIRQQLPRTRHLSTYHSLASHKGQADKFPESQVWEAHAQHCSDTCITSSHSTMLRISWRVTNAESWLTFRTGFNGCFVAKFGDPRGDEVLIAFIFLNVGNLRSNSKQLRCCCHRHHHSSQHQN